MKNIMLTIGFSGAIWLMSNMAIAVTSQTVVLNDKSTVENVAGPSNGYSAANGDTYTPGGSGPWATFVIPPQTSAQMIWSGDNLGRYVAIASRSATQINSSLTEAENYAGIYVGSSNRYDPTLSSNPLPYSVGFVSAQTPENYITVNYASDSCPTVADASDMLNNNYATESCPTTDNPHLTFPDKQGRKWSIFCSNNNAPDSAKDPFTAFNIAQIAVTAYASRHYQAIECTYTNTSRNFSATLVNDDATYPVILPSQGAYGWAIISTGPDDLSGLANCTRQSSVTDTTGCQWIKSANPY